MSHGLCQNDLGGLMRGSFFKWDWGSLRDTHVKATKKTAMARGMGFTHDSETHRPNSGAVWPWGTCEGADMVAGDGGCLDRQRGQRGGNQSC